MLFQRTSGILDRFVSTVRKRFVGKRAPLALGAVLAIPIAVYASTEGPYGLWVFEPNTRVLSSEVNDNFEILGEHVAAYEDAITVDGDGNVGIGTTSPGAKLDVVGGRIQQAGLAGITGYLDTNRTPLDSTTNLNPGIIVYGAPGSYFGMDLGYNSDSSRYRTRVFAANYGDISFARHTDNIEPTAQSAFTDVMVIRGDNGNVGIGIMNPQDTLSVAGNLGVTDANLFRLYSETGRSLELSMSDANDAVISNTYGKIELTPNTDFVITRGNVGIGVMNPQDKLSVAGNLGVTDANLLRLYSETGRRLELSMSDANDAVISNSYGTIEVTPNTDFVITQGNVGIGTTTPQERLHVIGNVQADDHTYNSDERLKQDVALLENATEGINCLQGVSYRWRDPEAPQSVQIGLIAQEVEACFPEVVSTNEDGYKTVSYARLVAPLIEASKEQQRVNTGQQAMISRQQDEIARLKAQQLQTDARLARIEALLNAGQ